MVSSNQVKTPRKEETLESINADKESNRKPKGKVIKGLKSMRAGSISKDGKRVKLTSPEYHCDNCKCDRYSPCGCMKKEK